MYRQAITAGKDQNARTPPLLRRLVDKMFWGGKESFDPCPPHPTFDGLKVSWKTRNFVNPPFRELGDWIEKALAEKGSTAMLGPVRSGAKYFNERLLPGCNVLLLWTNRIAFPPHEKPLPLPIMVAGIRVPKIRAVPDVSLHRVGVRSWKLPRHGGHMKEIMAKAKSVYSPALVTRGFAGGTGVSFCCVMNSPKETLARVRAHLESHPNATVLAMIIPAFNATYFDEIVPYISEVVFMYPNLDFTGRGQSILGSVILVLTKRRRFTSQKGMPVGYFVSWTRSKRI
jgi:hypothetical protein